MSEIFEVTFDDGGKVLANQSRINYYKEWRKELVITNIESIGSPMPKNFNVVKLGSSSSNCYIEATYEITADEELTERDMEIIRLQYNFLSGQETAKVNLNDYKKNKDTNRLAYIAYSVCDSSD